jgi:hypothetical protein
MGQPITVVEKPSTANPAILRLETNRPLSGMGHDRYESPPGELRDRPVDELARRLFAAGGVEGIHINGSVVTVRLGGGQTGAGLADIVRGLFLHYGDDRADTAPEALTDADATPEVLADTADAPAAQAAAGDAPDPVEAGEVAPPEQAIEGVPADELVESAPASDSAEADTAEAEVVSDTAEADTAEADTAEAGTAEAEAAPVSDTADTAPAADETP